ncbi:hypothetical protein DTL42_01215 [Bremerella cremea]|uniref:Uncharacterized protein n=1 Tax=Bremerella cremea TaxID=1031537 RepID=A0A368KZD1_9BACT|nr:hypothetical protein [Bremerella cremea]RCS56036.1 hypothetical protein DTL42_01215 [Bremerella cremea]
MTLEVWIISFFTAAIGLAAIWAAIFNIEPVFASRKIAFVERRIGRANARLVVGVGGVALLALAISFIMLPPG